jgi:hypothetical protein
VGVHRRIEATDAGRQALLDRGDRGHDIGGLGPLRGASSSRRLLMAAYSSRDETRPLTTGGSPHGVSRALAGRGEYARPDARA